MRRQAREMTKAIGELEQSLGRSATEPEIAKALDIDLAEYRQVLLDTNNSQLFSYDEWHEVHGESCEPSMDEDDGGNPLSLLMESSLKDQIVAAIEQLPEREKNGADAVLPRRAEFERDWCGFRGGGVEG
ncbi:Sigma-F factor [Providencia alcalifaciens]|nr:Sigma-F factor [Providencia alcalifaciens]